MLRVAGCVAALVVCLAGPLFAGRQDPPAPVVLGAAKPWTAAEAASRMTAKWKLNDELSPAPRAGSSPTAGAAPSRGGGRGGGGRNAAPGLLTQRQLQDLRTRAIYRELTVPPRELSITATLASVSFMDEDGVLRVVSTNGKKEKLDLGTAVVDAKSRWDAAALMIEMEATSSLKLICTFDLAPTGRQLLVTLKTGEGANQKPGQLHGYLQRVYDRID
jgi:hypothetical protein